MPNGPAPKKARTRAEKPVRGEWQATPGLGWQHGPIPKPPAGLKPETVVAWETWMGSWFAAHWDLTSLPDLRLLILLADQVNRGEFQRMNELRLWMDTYGITPKGQQDRRWAKPEDMPSKPAANETATPYVHLRAVEA